MRVGGESDGARLSRRQIAETRTMMLAITREEGGGEAHYSHSGTRQFLSFPRIAFLPLSARVRTKEEELQVLQGVSSWQWRIQTRR